jgi:hypothetical protein
LAEKLLPRVPQHGADPVVEHGEEVPVA